jgi:hypothetical protein
MKTQKQINHSQSILNEKTRLDLKVNNVWAILVSIAVSAFVFGVTFTSISTKLDMVIAQQKELTQEFRLWKTQAETRLGTVESRQNTVVTYLNDHLKVNIK